MRFRFTYTGIRVTDIDRAIEFFVGGLGFVETKRRDVPETGGTWVELVIDGAGHPLELNWYPRGSKFYSDYSAGEALDHLAFEVEGGKLEEALDRLVKHGGTLLIPVFKEGNVRLAYVNGPDGHTVELWAPLSE